MTKHKHITIDYTADQVAAFAKTWPGCTIPQEDGWVEFDAQGNLVNYSLAFDGTPNAPSYEGMSAFIQDLHKAVPVFSISNAKLEGKVVTLKDVKPQFLNRKYLCTGGNGCEPTALGTKIFITDIETGERGFYVRRENIATIEDMGEWTPDRIPACMSTGIIMRDESGHPGLIGLSFYNLDVVNTNGTIYVHPSTLRGMATFIGRLADSQEAAMPRVSWGSWMRPWRWLRR